MNERVLLLLAYLEKGNPSAPIRSRSSCLQEDIISAVALQIPKVAEQNGNFQQMLSDILV